MGADVGGGGELAFWNFSHNVVISHRFGDEHFGAAPASYGTGLVADVFDFGEVAFGC